jgi:phosphoribosylformylglycinamidine synthase
VTRCPHQIWGAEYQENNAILVSEENLEVVLKIAARENCPVTPVGKVTGDGKVSSLSCSDYVSSYSC